LSAERRDQRRGKAGTAARSARAMAPRLEEEPARHRPSEVAKSYGWAQRWAPANADAVQLSKDWFSVSASWFRLLYEPAYEGRPLPPRARLASASTWDTAVPLSSEACAPLSVHAPIALPPARLQSCRLPKLPAPTAG